MLGKQKSGLTSITSGLPVNPEQAESSNHASATWAMLRPTCAETDFTAEMIRAARCSLALVIQAPSALPSP